MINGVVDSKWTSTIKERTLLKIDDLILILSFVLFFVGVVIFIVEYSDSVK